MVQMKKSINPKAITIQKRFFEAIRIGIDSGELTGGLKGFCERNNLNRVKYANLKKNYEDNNSEDCNYKIIDIDALSAICHELNISPEWLLIGQGKMFS